MKTITRRRMISGLGAGPAAAATPRIFAARMTPINFRAGGC